jgi:hypothetical protein
VGSIPTASILFCFCVIGELFLGGGLQGGEIWAWSSIFGHVFYVEYDDEECSFLAREHMPISSV